jgi:hypothetical protein
VDAIPRGRLLLTATVLTFTLAACGNEPQTSPTPGPATPAATTAATTAPPAPTAEVTTPPPSTPAVDKQITITIAKKKVTPRTGRIEVTKGNLVRVTVTSDVADALHIHGYDLEVDLPANTPRSIEFRADQSGLFEVETHDSHLVLFQLVVR